MCDEYRMNGDKFRVDANERIVKNSEIDQQWADWLAPTRRSFLFGAGAAAIGLTLGEEGVRAAEPVASDPPVSGPSAAFLALNGPIKPYVSADTGTSIKDQNRAIFGADAHGRRVPAVSGRFGSGGWD